MSTPSSSLSLDMDAFSGIFGSISIACWIVVFSPQIIENHRRTSADGLSLAFIIIWLLGDVFNVLGAFCQGVLPTMTILAVYYTLADLILLSQCLYYRGFRPYDVLYRAYSSTSSEEEHTESSSLLGEHPSIDDPSLLPTSTDPRSSHPPQSHVDGTHLSPATPLLSFPPPSSLAAPSPKPSSTIRTVLFNTAALILVCAAGVFVWWLSMCAIITPPPDPSPQNPHSYSPSSSLDPSSTPSNPLPHDSDLSLDVWGQIFGYLCAALYLGSRVPQLLLNHHRKSTEGVSSLFFLFACVGNLTYVLSIFVYQPACAKVMDGSSSGSGGVRGDCETGEWTNEYGRYILINASWLAGSAGTLLLDLCIFVQFWCYKGRAVGDEAVEE